MLGWQALILTLQSSLKVPLPPTLPYEWTGLALSAPGPSTCLKPPEAGPLMEADSHWRYVRLCYTTCVCVPGPSMMSPGGLILFSGPLRARHLGSRETAPIFPRLPFFE